MTHFIDGKDCMVFYSQNSPESPVPTLLTDKISEWILLCLAYMFVVARIYTRLFHLHQRLDCSDYLLIASALDSLGLIICDTLTFQMGVMDDYQTSEQLSKVGENSATCWSSFHYLSTLSDLICFQLLLRLWTGPSQAQHAGLLLRLL